MKRILLAVWEGSKIVIISLAIIIPVRYFLIQPFLVKGASMVPTFDNGEYLIINELVYRLNDPERGEVIVFKYPHDPKQYYIKRIIGLPQETVEIKGGKITIYNQDYPTGFILDETDYLDGDVFTWGDLKTVLTEKEYFVLGDNRVASSDSRRWGPLDESYIIGRVWIRAWPFTRAHIF